MKEFFLDLLDDLEILTGLKQLEKLQAKPELYRKLVDELTEVCARFPLTEKAMQAALREAVMNDGDFIGLNVKWVRKVLNEHCKVHGVASTGSQAKPDVDPVQGYQALIDYWSINHQHDEGGIFLERSKENLERVKQGLEPITDSVSQAISDHFRDIYLKQIAGSFIDQEVVEVKGGGHRLRENLSALPTEPNQSPEVYQGRF